MSTIVLLGCPFKKVLEYHPYLTILYMNIEKEIQELLDSSEGKRKKFLLKLSREELLKEVIKSKINTCCGKVDLETAISCYKYAIQENIFIGKSTYLNLLNLVAGFGEMGSGK